MRRAMSRRTCEACNAPAAGLMMTSPAGFIASAHFQRELMNVALPAAKQVGATGEVFHVLPVDLVSSETNGLVLVRRQVRRPCVERSRVVFTKAFDMAQFESSAPRRVDHSFRRRDVAARKNLA